MWTAFFDFAANAVTRLVGMLYPQLVCWDFYFGILVFLSKSAQKWLFYVIKACRRLFSQGNLIKCWHYLSKRSKVKPWQTWMYTLTWLVGGCLQIWDRDSVSFCLFSVLFFFLVSHLRWYSDSMRIKPLSVNAYCTCTHTHAQSSAVVLAVDQRMLFRGLIEP